MLQLLLILPFLEIFLLIKLGSAIGVLNLFWYVILSAFVGFVVLQLQGRKTWLQLNLNLARGEMPSRTLMNGLLSAVGGVLLMIPGVVTDVIGILLIIPFTRPLLRRWLQAHLLGAMRSGSVIFTSCGGPQAPPPPPTRDVIDVEASPLPPGRNQK